MPQISVIVPAYRVEEYLPRCVDSILGQSFPDFDLILVDDGSPDQSPKICDRYAEQDERVHVIHQENGGLSAARNTGLDWAMNHSDSQWLTFLDSDDWVHREYLERLLRAAETLNTGISVCGIRETSGEDFETETEEPQLWTSEDFYREHYVGATVACGKLYKKSCFETIRFPKGKLHEDEFTTYRVLFAAEKLAWVPESLYAYYVNEAGITKSCWNPRRMDAFEAFSQQIVFFDERGNRETAGDCLCRYVENVYQQLLEAEALAPQYEEEARDMEEKLQKLIPEAIRRRCLGFDGNYEMLRRFCPVKAALYKTVRPAVKAMKRLLRRE